jgi:hypothetical protein
MRTAAIRRTKPQITACDMSPQTSTWPPRPVGRSSSWAFRVRAKEVRMEAQRCGLGDGARPRAGLRFE